MNEVAIKIEQLGKRYVIGHQRMGSLRGSIASKIKGIFKNGAIVKEEFWALRDISFEVNRGDVVGIVGRNGAGKSTLLKILSRITDPTTGRFEIYGRVSSLLEVGTGFHGELTGRENVYLNGTILGMKRKEIKAKFDEIVEFSGVERFLDTPVKHYSSGMKVRLAFSVAAHLEPEILIIDEVLAVGDAEFQNKCLGKMDEVSKKQGRTVLFVSHDLPAVSKLCHNTILLKGGVIQHKGPTEQIIQEYLGDMKMDTGLFEIPESSESLVSFTKFDSFYIDPRTTERVYSKDLVIGTRVGFRLKVLNGGDPEQKLFLAITIFNSRGVKILTLDNLYVNKPLRIRRNENIIDCLLGELYLLPDSYFVNLWSSDGYETFQYLENAFAFDVKEADILGTGKIHSASRHGIIYAQSEWILND